MGEFSNVELAARAAGATWDLAKRLPRPEPEQKTVDPAAHYARIEELKRLITEARSEREVISAEWQRLCELLGQFCTTSEAVTKAYNVIVSDLLLPNPVLRTAVMEATASFSNLLPDAKKAGFQVVTGWGYNVSVPVVPLRRSPGGKKDGK